MKLQIENLVKLQDLDREIANLLGDETSQSDEADFDFDSMEKLEKMRKKKGQVS